jgi:NAD(P)-dependent dehydrogenase (short-subunit alcohol dehydrogenase family)
MSKVAVVTGSSGGIGKALVKTYLDSGYFVTGLDRNPTEFTESERYTEINTNLALFSKDLGYREEILQQIRADLPDLITRFVLINNAAEQILRPVAQIQWKDWEDSLAVNTVAPFFLAQGFIKELKACNGHVLNISSIHAKLTKPDFTCYAASKAALEGVTRSLALELSPLGVSVNAVAPAAIATDMLRAGFERSPGKLRELENYHPSKSIGTPEQVAEFVKSITDHTGGFLTGAVIDFNGGIAGRLYDPD